MCWPREVQSSIRVAKESWGLLSSDCRANKPHLGLCPEASVPLQVRQGSRGCIPDAPGETGIHLEWKHSTPLCAGVATVNSWSSLGELKGVKPPEAFGESSRDWSLTKTGTRAKVGTIAVDPKVIPMGTEMYIEGLYGAKNYGTGKAEDIGGAIKGKIIDLYFDTHEETIQWGRQQVNVYILKED